MRNEDDIRGAADDSLGPSYIGLIDINIEELAEVEVLLVPACEHCRLESVAVMVTEIGKELYRALVIRIRLPTGPRSLAILSVLKKML